MDDVVWCGPCEGWLKLLHTTSTITHSLPSTLPQPSPTASPPHYLNHHSQSTLPQPSLTLHTTSTIAHTPYYFNHHSHHTTSTITHATVPQPSLTLHYLNHHSRLRSQLDTTSTITSISTLPQASLTSTLPQPSLTTISHRLHTTSTITRTTSAIPPYYLNQHSRAL